MMPEPPLLSPTQWKSLAAFAAGDARGGVLPGRGRAGQPSPLTVDAILRLGLIEGIAADGMQPSAPFRFRHHALTAAGREALAARARGDGALRRTHAWMAFPLPWLLCRRCLTRRQFGGGWRNGGEFSFDGGPWTRLTYTPPCSHAMNPQDEAPINPSRDEALKGYFDRLAELEGDARAAMRATFDRAIGAGKSMREAADAAVAASRV